MRPVVEHLAAVLARVSALSPVSFPLGEARGLVAAAELRSRVDLPGFDNSAMDGYAVRAADLVGASDSAPRRLPVVAHMAAGDSAAGLAVGAGQAIRIMTGAPMPEGADAVVPVEDSDGGVDEVTLRRVPEVGRHVRPRGEDVRSGQQLLEAGLLLTPGRSQLRVLNEAKPWACVRCSKPFGTVKAIEAMLGKLSGHAMFQGEALERLKMCSACRVIDLYSSQSETKVTDL